MSETDPHVASLSLVSVKTLESVWMQKEEGVVGQDVRSRRSPWRGLGGTFLSHDWIAAPHHCWAGLGGAALAGGTQVGGLYIGRGWLEEIHRGWKNYTGVGV